MVKRFVALLKKRRKKKIGLLPQLTLFQTTPNWLSQSARVEHQTQDSLRSGTMAYVDHYSF